MDCSPPGSSVHGDSPGKSTGVGCHGDLPHPGTEPMSLMSSALAGGFFPTTIAWKPSFKGTGRFPETGKKKIGINQNLIYKPRNGNYGSLEDHEDHKAW